MQEEVIQGYRLSPQQRHLWLAQGSGGAVAYRAARALLVEGPLDAVRMSAALADVISRHEILRTTFTRLEGERAPVQVINEEGGALFDGSLDLSGLKPEERQARLAAVWRE